VLPPLGDWKPPRRERGRDSIAAMFNHMHKFLAQSTLDPLRTLCCASAFCLIFIGCSTGPATGTVSGEVTFDGQPIEDGRITFIPVDGQSQPAGAAIIIGKFDVKNVPVTKMKVEINGNKKTGKKFKVYDTPESPLKDELVELIPVRYNVNSELTLDVKKGSQTVRYDLKK
jgi:hypothetical protein